MKTLSTAAIKPRLIHSIHPFETALSADALLAEVDELADWSEYQGIEAMLHEHPSHGIQIAY